MIVYCSATPSATCFGFLTASRKSSNSSVSPMPSMVTDRARVMAVPLNQVTMDGAVMPTTAPRRTQRGNAFVAAFNAAEQGRGDPFVFSERTRTRTTRGTDGRGPADPPLSSGTP